MDNAKAREIADNIERVLVGQHEVVELVLAALVAGGHVLLDDMPGTGKTMLARSLARSIDASFHRVQFTPDLLPSDVVGINYFNQKEGDFVLRKGPVFCNVLLADEINRATPRTQSSLLESMEERQVTIEGQTLPLDAPFFVIATQNPVETAGTYPLPEAQLDRFLMQLSMGEPSVEDEVEIMERFREDGPFDSLEPVCTAPELVEMQRAAREVYVHPELLRYVALVAKATGESADLVGGISPRGSLAMTRAARAYAFVRGRDFVTPEDIKALSGPVWAHRLVFPRGTEGRRAGLRMMDKVLRTVPVPTENWNG